MLSTLHQVVVMAVLFGVAGVAHVPVSATPPTPPGTEAATTGAAASPTPRTVDEDAIETIAVGMSVQQRPITALRRGDPEGRRVLIIGVIHGDEQAGLQIVALLAELPVPDGVDLYLVHSMNPDGVAANTRHNAHGVDLNRNFPYNWGPIAEPGDWQYAGPAEASEPETRAVVGFITGLRPDLVIWYHQDAYSIAQGRGRDGAIRARYAELTDLPMASVTGGTYTGVAAQWARDELAGNEPRAGVAFIVELGATLSDEEARMHADAVRTIASEDN
jgi:protein MpaA